jgi:hypothetical protein
MAVDAAMAVGTAVAGGAAVAVGAAIGPGLGAKRFLEAIDQQAPAAQQIRKHRVIEQA